jgi:hypothetical protein
MRLGGKGMWGRGLALYKQNYYYKKILEFRSTLYRKDRISLHCTLKITHLLLICLMVKFFHDDIGASYLLLISDRFGSGIDK